MDSVDIASPASHKWHVNKKNRDWHKRLHLRKTADQPPTMQSEDKRGPKKIAEDWEQSTVWPSSKKPPQEAQESRQRTNDDRNPLRFTCSLCRDSLDYAPKDLVRHFEEKHRGSPPVFSCHMCTFSTQEFSYLQVHLLSHKDTFSSCSVCRDSVHRTWPEFSAHLSTHHCQNGKYSCEMCHKFSTGDVGVFLEHTYAHNLTLEGANDDLHTDGENKHGPRTTTQTLRCQHRGYETSRKFLLDTDVKAARHCPNVNQRKMRKKEVHSIAMKPNDPIPKIKPRLTRSAVKEMCWLTQDCLSLPGREFLDKYCHLSDPQTTLEETQQFLMKSVAGETGGQKWTTALKSVLSSVPPDMNLHPMSENGIMSKSSDVTVLTVKNKITVAQNSATYAKTLKMMTATERETVSPVNVSDDARGVVDQTGCQSDLNSHSSCPQTETKQNHDVSLPANGVPQIQTEENRENRNLKIGQEIREHGKKHEEPMHEDGINVSGELKMTNESDEQRSIHKVAAQNKRRNRRRKRKARCKKADKRSSGLPLKIVLKKNPVKEKQWVSQSSFSLLGGGLPSLHTTLEETAQILHNALHTEAHQRKWTKASKADLRDPCEADTSISLEPGEGTGGCASKPVGSENVEMRDGEEKSLQLLDTNADVSESAGRTSQSNSSAAAVSDAEVCRENAPGSDMGSAADGGIPHSSYTKPSPVSRLVTPQGKISSEDLSLASSSEQSVETTRGGEVSAHSAPDLLSNLPTVKAIQQEPSPASGHQWQPAAKNLERSLKLVAINPYQLVKRPAGDQPVVVLNHPDADIPEVARIMEVVNRYRGEVLKVVLSHRTVSALSAMKGEAPKANDPADAPPDSAGHGRNCVQERFVLKLKLRRLSRKKYEVVGAASPSRDAPTRFRCWFCGRVFDSQETWVIHRQRHLMEWK